MCSTKQTKKHITSSDSPIPLNREAEATKTVCSLHSIVGCSQLPRMSLLVRMASVRSTLRGFLSSSLLKNLKNFCFTGKLPLLQQSLKNGINVFQENNNFSATSLKNSHFFIGVGWQSSFILIFWSRAINKDKKINSCLNYFCCQLGKA